MKNISIFPDAKNWIAARGDSVQITDQNCVIVTPKPISELTGLWVKADSVEVTVTVPQNSTDLENETGVVTKVNAALLSYKLPDETTVKSLTEIFLFPKTLVVEKEKWFTLPLPKLQQQTLAITKLNTTYWEKNTQKIYLLNGSYKVEVFGNSLSFPSLIQTALNLNFPQGTEFYYVSGTPAVTNHRVFVQAYKSSNANCNPMKAVFRVEYVPLGENVKINVVKANLQDNDFAIPYSQQQQIASTVGLGRNMQSNTDRLGTIKREVVRYKASPYQIGAYYTDANGDIWRLTDIDYAVVPQFIKATETWAKNWSIKSKFVGVNREFRSWDIPSDILQRNLLYQDYLLLSETTRTIPNNSLLVVGAKKTLIDGIATPTYSEDTEMTSMFLWQHPTAGKTNGVVVGCNAFGFGNSIVFSGKTKDNLSAGTQRIDSEDTGNYQYNEDVYYCNADGTLESVYIQFCPTLQTTSSGTLGDNKAAFLYPNSWKNSDDDILNMPQSFTLFTNDGALFTIKKDPAEQINFTYQVHILTSSSKLIIGTAWAANCPLVRNHNGMTIKIWDLTAPLPQGAQVMTSGYGAVTTDLSKFQTITTAEPFILRFTPGSGKKGVCVTDGDNNIMVAYNGTTAKDFYAYFTHKYKDLK